MIEHSLFFAITELGIPADDFAENFYAAGGVDGIIGDEGPGSTRVDITITERADDLETAIRTVAGWVRAADPQARIETIEVEPTPELLGVAEARAAAA